jgi:hypothetical protein
MPALSDGGAEQELKKSEKAALGLAARNHISV